LPEVVEQQKDDLQDVAQVRLTLQSSDADHTEESKTIIVKGSVRMDYPLVEELDGTIVTPPPGVPREGEVIVECDDVDLSSLGDLTHGIFDLFAQLSFNDQDFAPLAKDAPFSICHAFHPLDSSPSCYPMKELDRMVELFLQQENAQVDSFAALQEGIDFRPFERKIVVHGESLFPSTKLQKGTHIMAVISGCSLTTLDGSSSNSLSNDIFASAEELIVHGDSSTTMHFTVNSSHLRQVHAFLHAQTEADVSNCMTTIQYSFLMETPTATGMEKVSLSENTISLVFYPAMKSLLSESLFARHSTSRVSVITRDGGIGFPFYPSSCVVRLHSIVHDSESIVKEFSINEIDIVEMTEPNNLDEGSVNNSTANNDSTHLSTSSPLTPLTYSIKIDIPNTEELSAKLAEGVAIGELFVSISLDGLSIPQRQDWMKISFFDTLNNYTLQAPVPKGGAAPGSTIALVLMEHIPTEYTSQFRARFRGSDPEMLTPAANVTLTDTVISDRTVTVVTVHIPDAGTMAKIVPVMNGKDKLYYIDLSGDNGLTFDLASNSQIQLK
jgi:hypothetical protein